jgi:16S rRNA processing protein RimM
MDEKNKLAAEELVRIGRIVASRGNRGEVKVILLTDFPERFKDLKTVYLIDNQGREAIFKIESARYHKDFVIIKFEGVESISQAEVFRGSFLAVRQSEAVKLPVGSYYIFEIVGLDVYTEEGKYLGKVQAIWRTGSNDVYVIKDREKELLFPALRETILRIDLAEKKMIVHRMDLV